MRDFLIAFIIAALFLVIPIFLIYLPVIIAYFKFRYYDKRFHEEMQLLAETNFFERHRICVTEPLGLGEEPSGSITFETAMKNQSVALSAVLSLVN